MAVTPRPTETRSVSAATEASGQLYTTSDCCQMSSGRETRRVAAMKKREVKAGGGVANTNKHPPTKAGRVDGRGTREGRWPLREPGGGGGSGTRRCKARSDA